MFVLYCMYILYKHTGPDTCHIHRNPKNICPGVQNNNNKKKKLKTRSSKTAFSDHLKTKNKKTCPNVTPHKPAASLHVHQDHHAPVCVWGCVCLWVCVCVYTRAWASCLVCGSGGEKWEGVVTPRVILTILRPCTTGGTKGGGDRPGDTWGQRSKDAEKWRRTKGGRPDRERGTA